MVRLPERPRMPSSNEMKHFDIYDLILPLVDGDLSSLDIREGVISFQSSCTLTVEKLQGLEAALNGKVEVERMGFNL